MAQQLLIKQVEVMNKMLVAIPVFGDEVSPRFGYTTEMILAVIESGKVCSKQKLIVTGQGGMQVYSLLLSLRPQTLICGGIHRRWQRMLEHENIKVLWGVVGRVDDALNSFAKGGLNINQFVCPGRRNGRGRRQKRGYKHR